jgi:hypothetical protein
MRDKQAPRSLKWEIGKAIDNGQWGKGAGGKVGLHGFQSGLIRLYPTLSGQSGLTGYAKLR